MRPDDSPYLEIPLTFGQFRRKRVEELMDGRGISYLKWVLTQDELEWNWGPTIRRHLDNLKVNYGGDYSKPIRVGGKVIDKFSLLFFDKWLEAYQGAGEATPVGFHTFLVQCFSTVYSMFKGWENAGKEFVFGKDEVHRNYLVGSAETIWFFHDAGPVVTILNVLDLNDLPMTVASLDNDHPRSWTVQLVR